MWLTVNNATIWIIYTVSVIFKEKSCTHIDYGALAGVKHSQFLVLAGSEDLRAVSVPAGAVDQIRVHWVNADHCLSTSHVPQDDHVITACMKKTRERVRDNKVNVVYKVTDCQIYDKPKMCEEPTEGAIVPFQLPLYCMIECVHVWV